MSELKLTYFDLRGRAEPIRLALLLGGVPFEDDRIGPAAWGELKPTTPYGGLPVMKVDGQTAAQSHAILRYAGKLGNLYPTDPLEALRVDEVIDAIGDLTACMFRYKGKDKDALRADRDKLASEDIPRYFGGLEKRLESFGDGPWAVGEEMTIADLVICQTITTFRSGILDYVGKDVLDSYPRGTQAYNAVMELPKVKEWYKKYPIKIMS